MPISSPANPRIKQIRALRQRKEREQTGLFFVEGIRIVTEAVQLGAGMELLVVAPDLLRSEHARALAGELRRQGVPCIEVTRDVFESLSVKEGPQGIGAVVRQRWERLEDIRLPSISSGTPPAAAQLAIPGLCWVALDAAQDPGNIGTILRTSDAVGGSGLILLGHSADPYDPSAVRASMGAIFSQRLVRAAWEQFAAWKREQSIALAGTSGGAARDYQAVTYPSPLVLLMGSEREGLSPEQQAACDLLVRIPMVGRSDSLNLAVATAVVLYELFNQRRRPSA